MKLVRLSLFLSQTPLNCFYSFPELFNGFSWVKVFLFSVITGAGAQSEVFMLTGFEKKCD